MVLYIGRPNRVYEVNKTRQRNLNRLREMELLFLDESNQLWPGLARPRNIKPVGRKGARAKTEVSLCNAATMLSRRKRVSVEGLGKTAFRKS